MFTNKFRAVLATLGKSKSIENKQPPPNIAVIFIVAIAIRKFQRLESDKFKKSLIYNFDRHTALDELKHLYASDKAFFVDQFVKLANVIRKFNLTFEDLDAQVVHSIYEHLKNGCEAAADQRMINFLCLSLKYLTQNSSNESNPLEISSIAKMIGTCNNPLIKNELVTLLVCRVEKLNSNQCYELKILVRNLPELNQDAKAFLLSKLEHNKAIEQPDEHTRTNARTSMAVRKFKKNQQVVSKTIQTVKSKQETKKSEETDFKFLNLSDCMKNRNKRFNRNTVLENLEQTVNKDGDDRSIWRTTWAETINLFSLVSQGQVLKNDDKNNYLPDKFLGSHYFTGTFWDSNAAKMYSFFINRMCASIFLKVSRKQELNGQAVDKLMKCVTDFQSQISVLGLEKDYVKWFVDRIFKRYGELKEITSPDIIVKFVKDIMTRTVEEYLVRGWIYNSTKVRRKSYDPAEVEEIISTEINRVRLDAIKALYNCAIRDKKTVLTKKRLETIRVYAQVSGEDRRPDKTFMEYIFKLIELAETLEDFDYADTFKIYLGHLNIKSMDNVDAILRFVNNQARDVKRSEELFNDKVIATLITYMGSDSPYNSQQKLDVLEIINTYLEHESTKCLSEENLNKLLINSFGSNDTSLINSGLTSLLLSTDKTRSLSQSILGKLLFNFNTLSLNEECTSYIIFILSRVFCADDASNLCFLNDQNFVELVSSKMLCNHIVELNDEDGERIKFKEPPENNSYSSSNLISLLVAKIISRSVENKVILSSVTIDNLLLVLNSGKNEADKQTKIVASKCLYGLTKYMSFEDEHLNQLLDLINNPIYDVSVHVQTAYLRGCVKVAQTRSDSLDPIHLENISALYAPESLKLGQHDYEGEINKNLFRILLYEARKREFNDKNIFLLYDSILNLNGKYASEVLGILVAYTSKYIVPEATLRTLENLLSVSSYFEKALLVLQNVIRSGRLSVMSKTLAVFIDYLCLSSNSRLRFYSFKLLEIVSQNQELPYDIFCKFELVRAGYALECRSTQKQMIFEFIETLTDKGIQLPIDTKLALEKEISHTSVLKIFANVSRSKQIIERNLLQSLIELFNPETDANNKLNTLLITIFENAAKNNQTLPRGLLENLERALGRKDLKKRVLPVFIYLAQKGEKLSRNVNEKLLDSLTSEQDPVLRQELLSSLGSLIDANQRDIKLYLSKVNQILINEVKSDNFNIQKLCITAIYKLVTVSKQIDDMLLAELVRIGTDLNCNKTIRNEVQALFESIEDNYNPLIRQKHYRDKIKLANLNCNTPKDMLEQLRPYANIDEGFLLQNYKQLKKIIENGSTDVQEETLDMLHDYRFKSKMTDELLESVAILFESTMLERLKNSCLKLFNETVASGKTLKGRALECWSAKLNRDKNIKKFFQSQLCNELKQEFQISEDIISDLLQLVHEGKKFSGNEELADLIQLIVEEKSDYFESQSFVMLIERCLLKFSVKLLLDQKSFWILEVTLPCYCRIIMEKKCSNVGKCLEALVLYFAKNEQELDDLHTQLFESMYHAHKYTQLPDVCMNLVVDNLDNSNEIIRGYSFKILRNSNDKNRYEKYEKYASTLSNWCHIMLESLAQNTNVEIEKSKDYLDLLEIIVSVKFLDVAVFKEKERKTWKRELLVSSIFESFKVFQIDQIHFYTNWFEIEEKFKYNKSCKLLSLIQNSNFNSFSQILELTLMIFDLNFDDVYRMLSFYCPEPYEAFKNDWCIRKIQACVSNKDGINNKYSIKLAEKLCSSFDVRFIGKLFRCLKSIDNLSSFEDLICFCSREKIDLDDVLDGESVQLNDLRRLIEAKHLCNCVKSHPESEIEEKSFLQIFRAMNDAGWNFVQLREIVTAFNPEKPFNRFQNLLHLLETIHIYNLSSSSNFEKIKEILANTDSFQVIIQKLNKLAIENHFQLEGKVKDLNELTSELKKTNKSDVALVHFIDTGSLDIRKNIFEKESVKLNWNEKQIYLWAKDIKSHKKKFTDYEAIAVILRANYLITGHTLTDTQILCSLIALRSGGNLKGKLLQVATGEGKSTIICILAIISALRGKQVDVITSSPVLAERDAKQKAKLYRMFSLTCDHNNDRTVYLKGRKDCYLADIVYGEMSQFQFDILRNNYSKLGTLAERKFSTAVVDEVDSMLIDDSSKIARLSSTIPGMDHFQAIYVYIWQYLISIKEKFIMFNNKLYFVNGKVGFEDGKITLEIVDNSNDIVKIPDLENYILNTGDKSQAHEFVGDDIDGYLMKTLESYLDYQIRENKIYIPSNFVDFLAKQKSKWITNAVEALNYQENMHYVVHDGEIKPVDYYGTGIVQSATKWSDGLHQFLQLKHNLKMTSETLTTNFLSNIGFMKKYEQVYGLTGTLGSETARNVLKDIYMVDLINIPQRRQKQYLELESVVAQGEDNWLKEITSNIMLEIQKDRGILVICETIEHANRISGLLKNKLRPSSVKLYTMNDMNQEKNVEKILSGEVIIATNLAGRGTDIQTDEIEESGGLHVILTFMPSNQRVEDQAFGRTARQGKRGTGLMILNAHNLVGNATTKKDMKMERDKLELNQLKEFKEKDLKLIQVKDKLFDVFCAFLNNEIRLSIRKEHNSYASKVLNWFTELLPTTYECSVLGAVEEQWAGFLSKLDEGTIKCEDAEKECNTLIDQLRSDFKLNRLIKNPYYNICIANDILVNEWAITSSKNSSKIKRALDYFEKAIKLEEKRTKVEHELSSESDNFGQQGDTEANESSQKVSKQDKENSETLYCAGAAYLGKAWCSILLKEEDYKDKALSSFKSALKCLSNEMSLLNATQLLLEQKQVGFVNSDLYKQLNIKATILGSYLSGISGCIDAIKRSKRLIDLVAIKKHTKDDILETITYFNEQERNKKETSSFKNKDLKLSSKESYSLTFNHLTTREDSGTIDQAVITLRNAFDESILEKAASDLSKLNKLKAKFESGGYSCLDNKSYKSIQINLKQVDLARIKSSLLNPNKEYKDLTRQSAIANLNDELSYGHKFGLSNSLNTNLTITSNKDINFKMVYENEQINELIKIVEKQEIGDEDLRFDIVIKKANENEINKLFTSNSERSVKLNIDFDKLNQEAATAILCSIKAMSIDIEFVLSKSNLFKLIAEKIFTPDCGKLYISEKRHFEKVNIKELLRRVGNLKTDESPCFVKFEQLKANEATNLVKSCQKNVLFTVFFSDIYNFNSSELDEGQINFSFDELDRDTAEMVINVLRKENFEFSLEFKNLSDKEVRFVLQHASLEQEHMEIRNVKNVRDLFMTRGSPTLELDEFVSKGIEYIPEMNERMFVPWWSVSAVAALGVGQVIFGGVLIATGFGSTAGMGLVTEGLADIFTAYRAYSTRRFQWSDYCKQKAVSLAISAISMGYSKLKEGLQNAAKGIETITTEASRELLEQAGTQLVSNNKIVGQTMIKTGANLKSLASKFVGVKAAEAVAREGLNTSIQCLSNFSFDLLRPKISESVQSNVRISFSYNETMCLLQKMYAIDLATHSQQLQSRVEQIVLEAINPRHDFMRRQWDSIGLPLLRGVLSDSSLYGSSASMVIRIIGTLNGLNQVQALTNNVVSTVVEKLKLVDRNSMTITLVLHRCLKIKRNNANVIVNKLKSLKIFDNFDNFDISQSDEGEDYKKLKAKIDKFSNKWRTNPTVILEELGNESDSMADDIKNSIDFVEKFYGKFIVIDLDSFNPMIKSVSDKIADQLTRIMDSQLLQPWSTLAVSSLTDAISKRLQHYYLVNKKQNSDSHNADQIKYEKLLQKQNLTLEEKEFMSRYGKFRNFVEQINYNSRDHCDAYMQCEMAYYACKDGSVGGSSNINVKQTADNIRNGKPVSFAVMIATAKRNGVKLKIVDDKNYVKTQEDIDNGVQVVYVEHGPNNEIGHALYMDNNGQFLEAKAKGWDCFFAAFSKILENNGVIKSIADLRTETANQIESNSRNFSKVVAAETWIRKAHPDSANNLLFTAGLRKESGKLKVEDEDVEGLRAISLENINETKQKKTKRGGRFAGSFKKSIKTDPTEKVTNPTEKDTDPTEKVTNPTEKDTDPTKKTCHHIFPLNGINKLLNDSLEKDSGRFKESVESVEEFANKPPITTIIDDLIFNEKKPVQKKQHGELLYSAISMNPHNLVRGPEGGFRGNDPKSKIDKEILGAQSDEYKKSFEKFENKQSLDNFLNLPPTKPVEWSKDKKGKYVVQRH